MTNLYLLTNAYRFASLHHSGQKRKDAMQSPYINHPIEVAHILASCGVTDLHVLSAAVLHDVIEDTLVTAPDLVKRFGQEVCKIVLECTDDKSLDKVNRKKMQIVHAPLISHAAKMVKLADKISNCTAPKPDKWSDDVHLGYLKWSFAVCQGLYGENEELDKKAKEMFLSKGIEDVSEEELLVYFALINLSTWTATSAT